MNHLLLEFLIREILSEEGFTSLNVRSFNDRADRTDKFVDALAASRPLPLKKGEESVVVTKVDITKDGETASYDPKTQADELKAVLPTLTSGNKLYLYDESGKRYSITAVAKTKELGGKGVGGTLGPERAAIASLEKQFEEIGKPTTVTLGGESYSGITGVTNVKENQKADFALVNDEGSVLFISYKPGSSVKDVISYGGITGESEKAPDVVAFIKAIKEQTTDMKGLGYEFGVPLTDKLVAQRAIYGSDYGSKFGINNVQALMQGDVKLVAKGDVYELVSNHTILSPSVPGESYEPYLNARYTGDRNQFGIQHCRVGVVPKGARTNIKSPF
jgi:hypothetical protein